MTTSVAKLIERLRRAGFEITALRNSPLWMVEGRGNMTTGQLIDLESKLRLAIDRAA